MNGKTALGANLIVHLRIGPMDHLPKCHIPDQGAAMTPVLPQAVADPAPRKAVGYGERGVGDA